MTSNWKYENQFICHGYGTLLYTGLIGNRLLRWGLCLWLSLEVIDEATPYTLYTANVRLASFQVLIHVIQHLVCPLQSLTLSHQLLQSPNQ